MNGFNTYVVMICGCPKSTISSKSSYIKIKFFLIASSVNTPQKSLITLQILSINSMINDGDALDFVVQTI